MDNQGFLKPWSATTGLPRPGAKTPTPTYSSLPAHLSSASSSATSPSTPPASSSYLSNYYASLTNPSSASSSTAFPNIDTSNLFRLGNSVSGLSGATQYTFQTTSIPASSSSATSAVPMPLTGASSSTLGSFGQPSASGSTTPRLPQGIGVSGPLIQGIMDEDDEGENELLPGMADEDYSAQQTYQTESKDNLKVLMDNLSEEQYERFEAYRRHALPKAAVRKVIQQVLGQQVSQPVAQIVAGFGKVFVGEIVERARAVQRRRGDVGPLSPDHLREAYRMYQEEAGRVGAAKPIRGKKLFVR